MNDFFTPSLVSKESTFQTPKDKSFGVGGPGLGSTFPDWSRSDLMMMDKKYQFRETIRQNEKKKFFYMIWHSGNWNEVWPLAGSEGRL